MRPTLSTLIPGVFKAILFLFAIFLPLTSPAMTATDEFALSIIGLRYHPGERISEFDCKILGGKIAGIPRIPAGWTINISNNPADTSEVYGRAIHGTEFVSPEKFSKMIILIKVVPFGAPRMIKVVGYLNLYENDTTRRINLSNADFTMSPRWLCQE